MNSTIVGAILALTGVVVGNLMQIFINWRTNAHQLARDRQAEARAFRTREYERVRDACERLAASNRDRFAAARAMHQSPQEENPVAGEAIKRAILDANQSYRILGVEPRTGALLGQFQAAQHAVTAYWQAVGADRSGIRASDDEIKLREDEAWNRQQMLEQSVNEYLTQLQHTLGLVEHRTR